MDKAHMVDVVHMKEIVDQAVTTDGDISEDEKVELVACFCDTFYFTEDEHTSVPMANRVDFDCEYKG